MCDFRKDYESSGPMVENISPKEAMERLRRFEDEYFDSKENENEIEDSDFFCSKLKDEEFGSECFGRKEGEGEMDLHNLHDEEY